MIPLTPGCHPIYKEGVCCPVSWVCPGEETTIDPFATTDEESPNGSSEEVTCPDGVNPRAVDHSDHPGPNVIKLFTTVIDECS